MYAQNSVPGTNADYSNELLFSGFLVSYVVEEALEFVHFLVSKVFAVIRNISRRSD